MVIFGGALLACGDNVLFGPAGTGGGTGGDGLGGDGGDPTSSSSSSSTRSSSSSSTGGSTSTGTRCGNGICEPGESEESCPDDCGSTCPHPICEVGDALVMGCDACVDQVCAQDPFCCDQGWDDQCISQADDLCGAGCCGNGLCEGQTCASCPDDCGACVCGDMQCLGEDCSTCATDCGDCPACSHTACQVGPALGPTSCPDRCVTQVCMQDPSCCNMAPFDGQCQQIAAMLCPGGDPCINAVCAQHPQCCTSDWSAFCVAEAATICQVGCDCAHAPCDTGMALAATCDPCVAAICAADPYCCDSDWDGICVGEMATVCGVQCP